MKRLTLRIAAEEAFGRTHAALRTARTRGRLLALHLHDDAVVELCAFDGDPHAVAAALAADDAIRTADVVTAGGEPVRATDRRHPNDDADTDGPDSPAEPARTGTSPADASARTGGYAYVRVEPDATITELLSLLSEHGLLLDTPVDLGADAVTVDVVGTAAGIHAAADALPARVRETVTVEHLGDYTPEGGPLDRLTARQREVAAAAVAVGYYATPRRATIEDVAAEADCAPSTASEHLRKAEATVFRALLNDR